MRSSGCSPRPGSRWPGPVILRTLAGTTCPDRAEVKLADTGGDVAWVRLAHAEEILITVPTAFIASQGESGIGAWEDDPARQPHVVVVPLLKRGRPGRPTGVSPYLGPPSAAG
jgi:hypothetical protein